MLLFDGLIIDPMTVHPWVFPERRSSCREDKIVDRYSEVLAETDDVRHINRYGDKEMRLVLPAFHHLAFDQTTNAYGFLAIWFGHVRHPFKLEQHSGRSTLTGE